MTPYRIVLKPSAVDDLDRLRRYDAARIADAIQTHLSHEPTQQSKSRIKRLRGITNPDYRLRVGDYRVFYTVDTTNRCLEILRVLHKDETVEYYEELSQ